MRFWSMMATASIFILPALASADEKGEVNPEAIKKKLLERFDLNGDGNVDEGEKAKAAEQMKRDLAGGKIPDEMKAMLDRNGDGKVDPQEMAFAREMAARFQGKGGGQPQFGAEGGIGGFEGGAPSGFNGGIPPEVLKKFDKNKDGELDEKEQKAAMAALGPKKSRSQQLKEKLDLNGDGKITKDERETVAAERKAEQEEKKAKFKKKTKPADDE